MEKLEDRLLNKAKEAFVMAIELYNKPTIRYRVEGFSMFICNAWELMLKSHMIKTMGEQSIYFPDNPDRTFALSDCIKKVFTNDKDPLRINLEKIVELRNTSTHFITVEYEMIYVPLFQACVLNFNNKMSEFHEVDMTELVPQNYLTLSVSLKSLTETEISGKYPEIISKRLISVKNNIEALSESENPKFSININVNHYITKNKAHADAVFHIAKDGEEPVAVIKEVKDPEQVFKYSTKASIETISTMLSRNKIEPKYKGNAVSFNKYHFNNFIKFFGIKDNKKLCWKYSTGETDFYKYSLQALELIVDEIKKDPDNILDNIKNKLTPGAKEF